MLLELALERVEDLSQLGIDSCSIQGVKSADDVQAENDTLLRWVTKSLDDRFDETLHGRNFWMLFESSIDEVKGSNSNRDTVIDLVLEGAEIYLRDEFRSDSCLLEDVLQDLRNVVFDSLRVVVGNRHNSFDCKFLYGCVFVSDERCQAGKEEL